MGNSRWFRRPRVRVGCRARQVRGFSRPVPTIVFFVAMALSMLGLSHAVRDIPLGVAYSVWVGIGATLTFAYSAIIGGEGATPLQVAFVCGLVACVIGLKLTSA